MAIVSPLLLPKTPLKEMLLKPYACAICAGVYAPVGGPPPPMGPTTKAGWAPVVLFSERDSRWSILGLKECCVEERERRDRRVALGLIAGSSGQWTGRAARR